MERTDTRYPRLDPVGGPSGLAALTVFILLCLALSALGGAVTATSVGTWYPTLQKPPFNPPDWVFAPVWTTLFLLIAIAGWRVWRRAGLAGMGTTWSLYLAQLALNLAWSVLFFGLRRPDLALIELVVLLSAIVATAILFRRVDRIAAWLFVPYVAWVAFAAVLNAAIWWLNPL